MLPLDFSIRLISPRADSRRGWIYFDRGHEGSISMLKTRETSNGYVVRRHLQRALLGLPVKPIQASVWSCWSVICLPQLKQLGRLKATFGRVLKLKAYICRSDRVAVFCLLDLGSLYSRSASTVGSSGGYCPHFEQIFGARELDSCLAMLVFPYPFSVLALAEAVSSKSVRTQSNESSIKRLSRLAGPLHPNMQPQRTARFK